MASSQDRIIDRVTVILGITELLLTETPGSLSDRQEQLLRDLANIESPYVRIDPPCTTGHSLN